MLVWFKIGYEVLGISVVDTVIRVLSSDGAFSCMKAINAEYSCEGKNSNLDQSINFYGGRTWYYPCGIFYLIFC